ncbi:MAG: hypothetical protein JNK67_25270 [Alphaproteobacteria bacterium]|nr:hypothetical protein [Alphaproteobacteria bacterium]
MATKTKKARSKAKAPAKRDQAQLVAESQAALRELAARIPRRYGYGDEPALTFDARQARIDR